MCVRTALKIDRGFIDGIAREPQEFALAAAIVQLAASAGKRTLAEGIERGDQLAHLLALGCQLGQGYLFARPERGHVVADYRRGGDGHLQAVG